MSVDERIGQLILPSYVLLANAVSPDGVLCKQAVNDPKASDDKKIKACGLDQIAKYHLGAVLSGGGPYFDAPTLQNWIKLNTLAKKVHDKASPRDPLLLTGNDAVHGNMHVQGAVIFPHNIGLGVTHDPDLIKKIGRAVGVDSLQSGFNWVYAPTLAIAQDLRWGRAYESFSQDPTVVKQLGQRFMEGIQNMQGNKINGPVTTAKHFLGDGATQYGFDEGDDQYKGGLKEFWQANGAGYEAALDANAGSLMVSYNAIDGDDTRMHFGGKWDVLNKYKQKFDGFVVSDWNGPTRAAYFLAQLTQKKLTLPEIYAKSLNGGVDMMMLGQGDNSDPFDPTSPLNFTNVGDVFQALSTAYKNKLISNKRLEEAVTRIIAIKLAMQNNTSLVDYSALQEQQRKLALEAAQKSLVLLKNEQNTLPLTASVIDTVFVIGEADDLGLQNGGWTINWQGQKGNQYFTGKDKETSGAKTLAEGLKQKLPKANFYFINEKSNAKIPENLNKATTIAIALVAEVPYAEFMGDIGNAQVPDRWYDMGAKYGYNLYLDLPQSQFLGLKFKDAEALAIKQLRAKNIKVITVVYSGRPMVLDEGGINAPFPNSDAVIAAFLPGTLGGKAITDALFGDYRFRSEDKNNNTLSFPWPRDMKDVENHFQEGAKFYMGYGLAY